MQEKAKRKKKERKESNLIEQCFIPLSKSPSNLPLCMVLAWRKLLLHALCDDNLLFIRNICGYLMTLLVLIFRYVKSRSDAQLWSRKSENETSACDPEGTTSDGSPIVPCGLIAWSLFNDTYTFSLNSKVLEVSKKNIAWKSDRDHKFGDDVYPKNFQSGGLIGGARLNASIPVSTPFISYFPNSFGLPQILPFQHHLLFSFCKLSFWIDRHCLHDSWVSKRILLFGCEQQLYQHSENSMGR